MNTGPANLETTSPVINFVYHENCHQGCWLGCHSHGDMANNVVELDSNKSFTANYIVTGK